MPRVSKAGHDTWKGRDLIQEKAAAGTLLLPGAIADIRLGLGMTQAEFGKAFRMTQRQISEIELGKSNPTAATLTKIGRALGLTLAYVPRVRIGGI